MKIEQIYTSCLAEASYYIEDNGEAAIIDPLRETQPYLDKLAKNGTRLKYIFETHFHADFVSGHVELAQKTGAKIIYGPNANTKFDIYNAQEQEKFKLGNVEFKALHTPGHTLESTCYLLYDESRNQHAIFTGDTLFIGDVGRPDLAIDNGLTKRDLAAMLYDSLRKKIMTLDENILIYPAHGAGSACGKNMSKETYDTLGNQKKLNYALRYNMSKDEFIKEVLDGIPPPPKYFSFNAMLNQKGYDFLDAILEDGLKGHNAMSLKSLADQNKAIIIDTRHQRDFVKEHIPGSIFIGLNGSFAPWVGTLLADTNTPILYVADKGKEEEVVTRLSRVGFDNNLGYLKGGIEAWKENGFDVAELESISAEAFANLYETDALNILDVRKPGEFGKQRIHEAQNEPLDYIMEKLSSLEEQKDKQYIHCAGGYRSVIFCSILKRAGIHNVADIQGGFGAIKKNAAFRLTEIVEC